MINKLLEKLGYVKYSQAKEIFDEELAIEKEQMHDIIFSIYDENLNLAHYCGDDANAIIKATLDKDILVISNHQGRLEYVVSRWIPKAKVTKLKLMEEKNEPTRVPTD